MARLGVERDTLARMLRSHGEDDLAERVASITDDELTRIGRLGAYYAFSEDALALGGSMGGTRALCWPRLTCLRAPGASCAVTTPTGSWRSDCLRRQTRGSAPETVSYGFRPLRSSCPVPTANRATKAVADTGGATGRIRLLPHGRNKRHPSERHRPPEH